MARPAVKVRVVFTTAQARSATKSFARRSSDPPADADRVDLDVGEPLSWVLVERHSTSPEFPRTMLDRVRGLLGLPFVQDGSMVHVHTCRHDETPNGGCVVTEQWERRGGQVVRTV